MAKIFDLFNTNQDWIGQDSGSQTFSVGPPLEKFVGLVTHQQ